MAGLRKLPDPPTDGITALSYFTRRSAGASPSEYLTSTSWDGCLRVHETGSSSDEDDVSKLKADAKLLTKQNMDSGPLLSVATCNSGNALFTGGLDGSGELVSFQYLHGCQWLHYQSNWNYHKIFMTLSFFKLQAPCTQAHIFISFFVHHPFSI